MRRSRLEPLAPFGGVTLLARQVIVELFDGRFYVALFVEQVYQIGVRSIPIAFVTAASTGMVMALQFGLGLEKFGGKLYIPKIVSLSIVREIGPCFTCLLLAARVGAGIASELGSMTVTQQIDAIRALGTSPIKRIVIPRVMGAVVSIPILCVFANFVGIIGAMLVGANDLGLDPVFFIQKVLQTVWVPDFVSGFGKTPFFAVAIALISCYFGLNVKGGTQGVGAATRLAVVTSSICILIGDYFLTKLFWVIEQWL